MKDTTAYQERIIKEIVWLFVYGSNGSILSLRDTYIHQCTKSHKALKQIADNHQKNLKK